MNSAVASVMVVYSSSVKCALSSAAASNLRHSFRSTEVVPFLAGADSPCVLRHRHAHLGVPDADRHRRSIARKVGTSCIIQSALGADEESEAALAA